MEQADKEGGEKIMENREWAENFKKYHHCETCPFVINEVDIGVGMLRDCGHVCQMTVDEIIAEMEGYGVRTEATT
jgi:hypothetical protein